MQFIFRLIYSVLIGVAVIIVVAAILLLIVWLVNRGLQFFCGLMGVEIGDFFGWLRSKLPKKKRAKKKRTPPPVI